MKEYPKTDAGRIERLEDEIRLLKVTINAILRSHERLALKALGDSQETAVFLGEIPAFIVEHRPEDLK